MHFRVGFQVTVNYYRTGKLGSKSLPLTRLDYPQKHFKTTIDVFFFMRARTVHLVLMELLVRSVIFSCGSKSFATAQGKLTPYNNTTNLFPLMCEGRCQ
jgi:hypothetical protein